jgi:hypothetical protein
MRIKIQIQSVEPSRTPLIIRTPKESEKLFQLTGLVLDFVYCVKATNPKYDFLYV